jgi:hypothetical protein
MDNLLIKKSCDLASFSIQKNTGPFGAIIAD